MEIFGVILGGIALIGGITLLGKLDDVKSKLTNACFYIERLENEFDGLDARVRLLEQYEDERYENEQNALQVADEPVQIADESDEHSDTSYEANLSINERILLREAEFDRRISEMKGVHAPILHPDVHNIPHKAVDLRLEQLPDVEVTD